MYQRVHLANINKFKSTINSGYDYTEWHELQVQFKGIYAVSTTYMYQRVHLANINKFKSTISSGCDYTEWHELQVQFKGMQFPRIHLIVSLLSGIHQICICFDVPMQSDTVWCKCLTGKILTNLTNQSSIIILIFYISINNLSPSTCNTVSP